MPAYSEEPYDVYDIVDRNPVHFIRCPSLDEYDEQDLTDIVCVNVEEEC